MPRYAFLTAAISDAYEAYLVATHEVARKQHEISSPLETIPHPELETWAVDHTNFNFCEKTSTMRHAEKDVEAAPRISVVV